MTSQWIILSSMLSALAAAIENGGHARRYNSSSVRAMATALRVADEDQDGCTYTGGGGRCLPRGFAPDRGVGGEPCAVSPGRGHTLRPRTRGGWDRAGSRASQAPRWTALYGYRIV